MNQKNNPKPRVLQRSLRRSFDEPDRKPEIGKCNSFLPHT